MSAKGRFVVAGRRIRATTPKGLSVSAVSTTIEGSRCSELIRRSERPTMEQDNDQARGGAMKAQNLVESAREHTAAAKTAATRSEQVRRVTMKRLHHLEPLVTFPVST
ncbi:hypothetical protein PR001_g9574 [Phytophthora rubi]|uniref:Uncharacterized protein n=1 Tax=Phytophthora rubi TaxID=129364 RepID=A0A6A3N1E2_9STRA|nr:hypothetical protein PR001_g9574 [Phytophthora rubi]